MISKNCFVVYGVLIAWSAVCVAQDDSSPSISSETNRTEDVPSLKDEIARLKKENRALQQQLSHSQRESSDLQKVLKYFRDQEFGNSFSHKELLNRLLDSDHENCHKVAVEHLLQSATSGRRPQLDRETQVKLLERLDSTSAEVRQDIINCLIKYDAIFARERGFQQGYWLPISENEELDEMREKLSHQMNYYAVEVPLAEILAYLGDSCDFAVQSESGFDITGPWINGDIPSYMDTPVNYSGESTRHEALGKVLSRCGLTFRIHEDHLTILPIDHPDARTMLVYNIRGLLTDELDIQSLVTASEDLFLNSDPAPTMVVLDEHRLMMTGLEAQHSKLSELLHSITH